MQELPYRIEQRHLSWRVLKDGSIRIHHLLLVEKEGHRKILVGKNGDVIRSAVLLEWVFMISDLNILLLNLKFCLQML